MSSSCLFHPVIATDRARPEPNQIGLPARLGLTSRCLVLVCAMLLPAGLLAPRVRAAEPGSDHDHGVALASLAKALPPVRSSDELPAKLPRLPKGVTQMKFGDMFVQPVGPRGLELTDKVRRLDGQQVRILGFMVQEETPVPGQFLFTPIPVQIHSHDNSLADDLPPSTLHVVVPAHRGQAVPFTPHLLLLTGVLEIGNRPEPDGRVSLARLNLDPRWKLVPRSAERRGVTSDKGAAGLMKSGKASK